MEQNQLPEKERKENNRRSLNALARYSGMAFEIAASIIIFLYIGKWLDNKFLMKYPLFTVVFTIIGVFAGVYFVIRDLLKHK